MKNLKTATAKNVRNSNFDACKPYPFNNQFYKVKPRIVGGKTALYSVVLSGSFGDTHYISEPLDLQGCADRINTFRDR